MCEPPVTRTLKDTVSPSACYTILFNLRLWWQWFSECLVRCICFHLRNTSNGEYVTVHAPEKDWLFWSQMENTPSIVIEMKKKRYSLFEVFIDHLNYFKQVSLCSSGMLAPSNGSQAYERNYYRLNKALKLQMFTFLPGCRYVFRNPWHHGYFFNSMCFFSRQQFFYLAVSELWHLLILLSLLFVSVQQDSRM